MKKTILLSLVAVFFLSLNISAADADLFSYDKEALQAEMSELEQLENYVYGLKSSSLSDLIAEENVLIQNINFASANPFGTNSIFGEPPMGIPSFLWGCVFNVWGVAIVYFVAEDQDETKKAFKGCVVSTLVCVLLWGVAWGPWLY